MGVFDKAIRKISYIFAYFGAVLVVLMMCLVLYEVFFRYVLKSPPVIADEFSSYMMVALSFLGGAYTFFQKGHVRIDVLPLKISTKKGNWLRLVTLILALAFAGILTYGSIIFMQYSFRIGARSGTHLRMPLQGFQMALPVGFVLLDLAIIVAIYNAVKTIREGGRIEDLVE